MTVGCMRRWDEATILPPRQTHVSAQLCQDVCSHATHWFELEESPLVVLVATARVVGALFGRLTFRSRPASRIVRRPRFTLKRRRHLSFRTLHIPFWSCDRSHHYARPYTTLVRSRSLLRIDQSRWSRSVSAKPARAQAARTEVILAGFGALLSSAVGKGKTSRLPLDRAGCASMPRCLPRPTQSSVAIRQSTFSSPRCKSMLQRRLLSHCCSITAVRDQHSRRSA